MSPFLSCRGLPAVYGGPKDRVDPFGQRAPGNFNAPNQQKSILRDGPRYQQSSDDPNLKEVETRFAETSLIFKPHNNLSGCNPSSGLQLPCSSKFLASPTYFEGASYRPAGSQMTPAQMYELEIKLNGRRPLARTPPPPAMPSSSRYPNLIRTTNIFGGKPQLQTSLVNPSSNRFMMPLHTSSTGHSGAQASDCAELRLSTNTNTTMSLEYDSPSEPGDDSDGDDISFNDAMTAISHFSIMPSEDVDRTDLPSPPDVWPSAPSSQSSLKNVKSSSASSVLTVSPEKSAKAEPELDLLSSDLGHGAHSNIPQQSFGGIETTEDHMEQSAAHPHRALSRGSSALSTCESDDDEDYHTSPVIAQRPCSPEVRIPGRYMSICGLDRVAAEHTPGASGTLSFNSLPCTENHAQPTPLGLTANSDPPGTVFPALTTLLNQWEKTPPDQEIPQSFIQKLKQVLDEYVLPVPSDSVASFVDESYLATSNNQVPLSANPGDFQHTSVEPACRDSELGWNAEVGKASHSLDKPALQPVPNWTPFSERSRVPASRQLIPSGKSSPYSQYTNSPTNPSLNQTEVLPNVSLPHSPTLDGECKSTESILLSGNYAPRRKNLQAFFGSGFGLEAEQPDYTTYETILSSKSRERRERKPSLALELSKTMRGFRLTKLQSRPRTGDSAKSSRVSGFLSDGGEDYERSPGRKLHKHQRHLSSASSIDRGDSSAPSLDDNSATSSSKRSRGVRFE